MVCVMLAQPQARCLAPKTIRRHSRRAIHWLMCVWTIPAVWFLWCRHSHRLDASPQAPFGDTQIGPSIGRCAWTIPMCGLCGVSTLTGQVLRPHVPFGDIQDGPSIGWCVWAMPTVWSVWCWHNHRLGVSSPGLIR